MTEQMVDRIVDGAVRIVGFCILAYLVTHIYFRVRFK